MTVQEFVDMMKSGTVIECDTVVQRKNALEFFDNLDIKIGPVTQRYMNVDDARGRDIGYMHPGFNKYSGQIVCYASIGERPSVHYRDVVDIVENLCVLKIDERSDSEFAEDFAELMC